MQYDCDPPNLIAQRKIIHDDVDAFHASADQRDNAELRGKPVAVGGSRGVVVAAASYEEPQVRGPIPDLIFVKPRFEVYKAISQQIRAIFAEHMPIIDPLSLDEAF